MLKKSTLQVNNRKDSIKYSIDKKQDSMEIVYCEPIISFWDFGIIKVNS